MWEKVFWGLGSFPGKVFSFLFLKERQEMHSPFLPLDVVLPGYDAWNWWALLVSAWGWSQNIGGWRGWAGVRAESREALWRGPGPWHTALSPHSLWTFGYVSYSIFLKATWVGVFLLLAAKSVLNVWKAAVKGKALKSGKHVSYLFYVNLKKN